MPELLREGTRTARKAHRCGMCNAVIPVGQRHHVSTSVSDGRVYDWRTCEACMADRVTDEVYDWAGMPDDGVGFDSALEWAHDAVDAGTGHPEIVRMARAFLARAVCGCERCEEERS